MPPIEFRCPHCSAALRVAETLAGRKVRCSRCSGIAAVPPNAGPVSDRPAPGGVPAKSGAAPSRARVGRESAPRGQVAGDAPSAAAASAATAESPAAADPVDQARALIRAGRYEEAGSLLRTHVKKYPQDRSAKLVLNRVGACAEIMQGLAFAEELANGGKTAQALQLVSDMVVPVAEPDLVEKVRWARERYLQMLPKGPRGRPRASRRGGGRYGSTFRDCLWVSLLLVIISTVVEVVAARSGAEFPVPSAAGLTIGLVVGNLLGALFLHLAAKISRVPDATYGQAVTANFLIILVQAAAVGTLLFVGMRSQESAWLGFVIGEGKGFVVGAYAVAVGLWVFVVRVVYDIAWGKALLVSIVGGVLSLLVVGGIAAGFMAP